MANLENNDLERGNRKTRSGIVVSTKMQKTAVVEVERVFRHPLFQKVMRTSKKFKAHDEKNECVTGDIVEIMETRPISRDKRWRVVKIIGKGKVSKHTLPKVKKKKEVAAVEVPVDSAEGKGENIDSGTN